MDIKIYDTLPEEAVRIREVVFVEEQGFQDEFDEIDSYAKHLVLFDGEKPGQGNRRFYSGKDCCPERIPGTEYRHKGSESRRGSHKEREGQQNLSSRTIAGKGFLWKTGLSAVWGHGL